tara:strand:- start:40 stop:678 length:639 start_codon:yes stop_codon:yes gene_type:complete
MFIWNCAGHSTISPNPLKKGQTYQAVTYSFESVTPVFVYRKGLSNKIDIGMKLGLPYGSGIDISQMLIKRNDIYYIVNLGYSWALNPSYDFTLYRMSKLKRRPGLITYYGVRGMYVPEGITGNQSMRMGLIIGNYTTGKFGYEIGFFHDFTSMPFSYIFETQDIDYTSDYKYRDYPHTVNGIPSEYSRLTGFSFRLNFPINEKKIKFRKKKK